MVSMLLVLQQSQVSLEAAGPVQMCQETIERLECVYELLFTGPEKLMRAFENKNLDRFKYVCKGSLLAVGGGYGSGVGHSV